MPYVNEEEAGLQNREWLFAEYATNPDGSRTKVPGTGIQVDRVRRYEIPNRGFNRPDQRYELPIDEIRSRRATRAVDELGESLCIRMDGGRIEVVSKSENRYDVNGPDQDNYCACPDFLRLGVSYPGEDAVCKHILIARLAEAARDPLPLDVGVLWIAERLGIAYPTVQQACRSGLCIATKSKRTWVISETDAEAFISLYQARMVDPDFLATLSTVLTPLVSNPSGKRRKG